MSIPKSLETVDYYGVDGPFAGCSSLSKINFEEGITVIPQYIFQGVTGLEEITIPDGVTTVRNNSFRDCTNLKKITFPESLETIGHHAFEKCTSLENVELPKNLKTLDGLAFGSCTKLASINIPKSLETADTYGVEGPFADCSALHAVTLEDGRTVIPANLFEGVTGLYELTIPEGITSIGHDAFRECIYLKTVNFPESLTVIGHHAFGNCVRLRDVKLPKKLETLGGNSFYNCVSITDIEIPASLVTADKYGIEGPFSHCSRIVPTFEEGRTTIPENMFAYCSGIHEYEIPAGITEIGKRAFENCSGLTKLIIPPTVTTLGYEFNDSSRCCVIYCTTDSPAHKYAVENELPYALTDDNPNDIKNLGNLETYIRPDDFVFAESSEGAVLTEYNGHSDTISLPEKDASGSPVVSIDRAFIDREYVLSVTVPKTVTSIKNGAFASIASLEEVTIGKNVTEIDDNVFRDSPFVTIVCYKDSAAHVYAYKNSIPFKLLDSSDPLAPPTVIEDKMFGDVDGDEEITAADALYVLRIAAGIQEFTPEILAIADVDGDEEISSADALEILRYSVGLSHSAMFDIENN